MRSEENAHSRLFACRVKGKTIQNWIFIDLFTLFISFSVAFLLDSMSYTEYIENDIFSLRKCLDMAFAHDDIFFELLSVADGACL